MNEDEINKAVKAVNHATAMLLSNAMITGQRFARAKQAGKLDEVAPAVRFTTEQAEMFVRFYELANDVLCLTGDRILADHDVQQTVKAAARGIDHG